jgi:hypothetical protein
VLKRTKQILAFFLITLINLNSDAQTEFDTTIYKKEFIKLSNGQLIIANNINLAEHKMRADRLVVDGKEYKLRRYLFSSYIIYYNHFGILNACYKGEYATLATRSKRLNFFNPVTRSNGKQNFIYYPYSKDLGKIKKISTHNLCKDFIDNPTAYKKIKQANTYKIISLTSLIVPFAGEVSCVIFYFLRQKSLRHALILYDPTLPQHLPRLFNGKQRKTANNY